MYTRGAPKPDSPHLRLIDSCITQLKARGPSRTCNESKEEEEGVRLLRDGAAEVPTHDFSQLRASRAGVRDETDSHGEFT